MGGGSGSTEYRRDGLAGSQISFLSCWIDGGRDLALLLVFLDTAALGSVARALFSCSSRASKNAVDLDSSQHSSSMDNARASIFLAYFI